MPEKGTPTRVQELVDIMASLRAPDGCPWDREQTHQTLRRYLIEECYELVDAIDSGDPDEMCEELGDVLLQVVFHAQLADERGDFTMQDVIDGISEKMIRRHPHVFGDVEVADAEEQLRRWNDLKRAEGKSVLGGVPRALPALERAQLVSTKVAEVGFDWPDARGVIDKIVEEVDELRAAFERETAGRVLEELGDVFFAATNLARKMGARAAGVLRDATERFETRFRLVEATAAREQVALSELSIDELETRWQQAKSELGGESP